MEAELEFFLGLKLAVGAAPATRFRNFFLNSTLYPAPPLLHDLAIALKEHAEDSVARWKGADAAHMPAPADDLSWLDSVLDSALPVTDAPPGAGRNRELDEQRNGESSDASSPSPPPTSRLLSSSSISTLRQIPPRRPLAGEVPATGPAPPQQAIGGRRSNSSCSSSSTGGYSINSVPGVDPQCSSFRSAREHLQMDVHRKFGSTSPAADARGSSSSSNHQRVPGGGSGKSSAWPSATGVTAAPVQSNSSKTLGARPRPVATLGSKGSGGDLATGLPPAHDRMFKAALKPPSSGGIPAEAASDFKDHPMIEQYFGTSMEALPDRLRNLDLKMIELILAEVVDRSSAPTVWDDIAGLSFAKQCVKEIVLWPMLRPDLFTGLRGPARGLLLFGPPGTGKTLIGKAIASESKSRFFSISASSLMSKWVGEAERMVRTLFAVASALQPSVVFIDEIDSLLSQRSDGDLEASRRVKTEFLVQLDGAGTDASDRVLVIGATNRPQELDEAARRRLVKRLYVPLPDDAARLQLLTRLFSSQDHRVGEEEFAAVVRRSDGYSGADLRALCTEAALGPIRDLTMHGVADIASIRPQEVRPVMMQDFDAAFLQVRASVSAQDLDLYRSWNEKFGSFPL